MPSTSDSAALASPPRRLTLARLIGVFARGPAIAPIADAALVARLYRRKRIVIMTALCLGYALAYTCRLGLSVMKKPLIDAQILSAEQLGTIGSALLWGYGCGKLVNGVLSDHANVKRFVPAGLLLTALLNLVMGGTTGVGAWSLLWGLNGWCQGCLAPGCVVSLAAWFSNRERGRAYGVFSTASSVGEGLTFVGSAAVVAAVGWRGGFLVPGLIAVAAAFAMYLALEDRPETVGLPSVAEWKNDHAGVAVAAGTSTLRVQAAALRRPAIWLIGLSSTLIYVTRYALNNWGVLYLQEAKGYTLLEAGTLLGVSTVGGVAGAVAFGFISDQVFGARRPPVNLLFAVAELGALAAFFWLPGGHFWLTAAAAAVYGFTINGLHTSLGGLFAVDLTPKRSTGLAMGVIGGFSYLGAGLQDRVTGALIERGTTVVDGVRHYDFGPSITFWVAASVLSMLLAATLWRVRPVD